MKSVAEILQKKNYSNRRLSSQKAIDAEQPWWLKAMFVMFISIAALGEWKPINESLAGFPKIITAGAIALAFLYCIIKNDILNIKKFIVPFLMYSSLIIFIMLWSLIIWIFDFTSISSISRGAMKMAFQFVSVMVAICGVYLFKMKSITLFFIGMCIANGGIMVLEIPNYGLGPSIDSLVHCLMTFGEAEGYARSLEIHEVTFLFGQFVVYYAAFAPFGTRNEKIGRIICLFFATFFFIVGMKRIAIPAIVIVIIISFLIKKRKNLDKIIIGIGIGWFIFLFYFMFIVYNGSFMKLMNELGVDMMGREYIWGLLKEHYTLSPSFMGLGFEAVDALAQGWFRDGLVNFAYRAHNDILKVFVELGFPGFCIWTIIQYIIYPIFYLKCYGTKAALLYISLFSYMTFTYMTDNTAFYFWCTMGLRLIPLAYAYDKRIEKPPLRIGFVDKKYISERIRSMSEGE